MTSKSQRNSAFFARGLAASILITTLFAAMAGFFAFASGGFTSLRDGILSGIALAFSLLIIYKIFRSGRIHYWRRIFFTTYAVAFAISFVWWTMGDRGHMWLLDGETLNAKAPMCHIVVPMLLAPMLAHGKIVFMTALPSAAFMILLVLVIGLIYGRAFCSWGCFYGGQDELFSSLAKKKRWKIGPLPPFVRYFSYALLAFIMLHALVTMSPTYCFWFCPFKTTTEFIEVNSFVRVIQTFLFVALWVILAVLLPIISKKRTQCGLFCPMGAFLSCSAPVNLFNVRIDTSRCSSCNQCIAVCPTFSITAESLAKGKPLASCTRCGACIDACPQAAIAITLKGVPIGAAGNNSHQLGFWSQLKRDLWDPGTVFIPGIFLLATIMASGNISELLSRLLKLFFKV